MPRGGSRLAAPFGRRDLMLKCALALIGLTAVLINFGPSPAKSQTPSQATPPAFSPGFADLMNTLVQPHHAKVGLSARATKTGRSRATPPMSELKDSLANIARWRPQFRNQSVADMMEATTGEPIKAVEQAIETRNLAQ